MTPSLRARALLALVRPLALRQPLTLEAARRRNGPPARRSRVPRGLLVEATHVGGVPVEVYLPASGPTASGTVVYVHGGGMIAGCAATQRQVPRSLMARLRMPTVSVDYRLAPEHPFPAGIEDVAAVLADCTPTVLVGDSAGGHLVLGALQLAHRRGGAMPDRLVLLWPLTDLTGSGASARTNAGRDVMRADALDLIRELYLAGHDPQDPLATALHADLSFLPPTLVQVGDADLLLDDARRLAARLHQQGVDVTLSVWPHMVHAWSAVGELFPEAGRAHDEVAAWVTQARVAP